MGHPSHALYALCGDLESSVAWALPLAIIKLPHLSLKNITQWLEKAQILSVPNTNSHFLKAYLIAKSGKGIIEVRNGTV